MTELPRRYAHFQTGDARAFVGGESLAVISTITEQRATAVWDLILGGATVDEMLDAFLPNGFRQLPDFALAVIEGAGVRVAVRGSMRVRLGLLDGGEVDIDGREVTTWAEHLVEGVGVVGCRWNPDALDDVWASHPLATWFIVHEGVVPVSALDWRLTVATPAAGPGAYFESSRELVDAVDGGDVVDVAAEADGEPGPEPESAPAVPEEPSSGEPSSDVPSSGELPPGDAPEDESEGVASPPGTGGDTLLPGRELDQWFASASPSGSDGSEEEPSDPASVPPGDDSDAPAESGGTLEQDGESGEPEPSAVEPGDYDHLFGATQFRSVERAAVRVGASDEHDDPDSGGSSSAGADDKLIEGIPGGPPGTVGVAPSVGAAPIGAAASASAEVLGDHDGMTMSKAQLEALLGDAGLPAPAASTGGGSAGGPEVLAIFCGEGHPNPAFAEECRICGLHIHTGVPQRIPRPVLGLFRFSDGREEAIDGPMVIGRAPKLDGHAAVLPARPVRVPSPDGDISRNHLEVEVDEWQVRVVDRSTNGTTVTLPGRPPQRIHPGTPFLVVPGSTVRLSADLSMTYETR